jgi:hypothetical protein
MFPNDQLRNDREEGSAQEGSAQALPAVASPVLHSALATCPHSVYNEAFVPEDELANSASQPRRWTVIASALLCGAVALVVLFTTRGAFFSPLAVVVLGAIGLAAVLLQLRLRNHGQTDAVRPPVWLNVLGILFAVAALCSDLLHFSPQITETLALGAVGSFAISSAIILHAFRKGRVASK